MRTKHFLFATAALLSMGFLTACDDEETTTPVEDETQQLPEGVVVWHADTVVNLIPWNSVEGLPFETPSRREIDSFCSALRRLGVSYTLRMEKGGSISGACGQLASNTREKRYQRERV